MTYLDLYEKHLHARHLVPATITSVKEKLTYFEEWLVRAKGNEDLRDVSLQDVLDFNTMLRQRRHRHTGKPLSPQYCSSHLYAITGYYRFLHETGRVLINPCADLPEFHCGRSLPKGVLTTSQTLKLLQQPDTRTLFGFRDRVILELLYSTGLRGLEVCRLSIYDVNLDEETILVRNGKGGKDRVVPMGKAAASYLREYLAVVRPKMTARITNAAAVERLFFSERRNPLQPQMLHYLIRRSRKKAELPPDITTHSLRHTCATEMLRGGASVRHVQEMLGHAQLTTTQIYTRVVPTDLKRVHQRTAPSEQRKKSEAPEAFTFNGKWLKRRKKRRKK
jgi:integrase/recombinase XerD